MKTNKGKFFAVAAAFLATRLKTFKFTGEYLECNFFTLYPCADGSKMVIEDDMGCSVEFTNLADFRDYLKRRNIKKDRKYYQS